MTNNTYCEGDCGDVFFYSDGEPLCIVPCNKQLGNHERCDDCFREVKP